MQGWSEAQLAEYRARQALQSAPPPHSHAMPSNAQPAKRKALQRQPNRTETEYRQMLELANPMATVVFEGLSFRLSTGRRYKCDWVVRHSDGRIEVHECKGEHVHREDSRVRFEMARKEWPCFLFAWSQKTKDEGWKIEI